MSDPGRQSVLFPALLSKSVSAAFDEPTSTSDGGALLVAGADRRLGLTEAFAAGLGDDRDASKVPHDFVYLVRQRVYGLACGYEDANDVAQVGRDPLFQLLFAAVLFDELVADAEALLQRGAIYVIFAREESAKATASIQVDPHADPLLTKPGGSVSTRCRPVPTSAANETGRRVRGISRAPCRCTP